jgi:hypothetical protein
MGSAVSEGENRAKEGDHFGFRLLLNDNKIIEKNVLLLIVSGSNEILKIGKLTTIFKMKGHAIIMW